MTSYYMARVLLVILGSMKNELSLVHTCRMFMHSLTHFDDSLHMFLRKDSIRARSKQDVT